MAKGAGADIVVEFETATPGTFAPLGGGRTRTISISSEAIEVTDADSVGRWRELIANPATRAIDLSVDGFLNSGTAFTAIRNAFLNNTLLNLRFSSPILGEIAGPYRVGSFEIGGDHDGAQTFSGQFQSAGPQTWTDS